MTQNAPKTLTSHRASVSFPPKLYETLEAIAREKRVSVAWVVRDAAEQYVADQGPLLGTEMREGHEHDR